MQLLLFFSDRLINQKVTFQEYREKYQHIRYSLLFFCQSHGHQAPSVSDRKQSPYKQYPQKSDIPDTESTSLLQNEPVLYSFYCPLPICPYHQQKPYRRVAAKDR